MAQNITRQSRLARGIRRTRSHDYALLHLLSLKEAGPNLLKISESALARGLHSEPHWRPGVRLARYSLKASMWLALIGKRLHGL